MAKAPVQAETAAGTAVAVKGDDQLPAHLQEMGADVAGLGNSNDSGDSTLPFLAIVQSNSPQTKRQEGAYIEGIAAGDIFNTATKKFWKGDEGVLLIACGFQKQWVEWVPRTEGGGYVDSYAFDPELPKKMGAKKDEKLGLITPSGNQLSETAYTFILESETLMPAVIGASSTALKPMRDWMALRKGFRIQGKPAPSFARLYRAKTVWQKNEKGDWYSWKFEDAGWLTDAQAFNDAKEIALLAQSGQLRVGRPSDAPVADDGGDGGVPL